ncbi:MAG: isopentenyl-diphosphate delta-isomerase [Chloroflexi bacterium]|nr:isopentenyl-diphosphate delta-isomerase [Chloroflexota bacterium]
MDDLIEARKADHLRLSAGGDVDARSGPGWGDVHLVHEALPELDQCAIDLSVEFLGKRLRAPLCIAGMTGGHQTAHEAPTAFLIGNIGAPQLIAQGDTAPLRLDEIDAAVEMIGADALAIHLNFLQESVQPEGERNALGCASAIRAVVGHLRIPVIAKETGAGLSHSTALRLHDLGARALDVGGVGGTSFAAVEGLRAQAQGARGAQRLGELLRDWGIPTPVAVVGVQRAGLPVIATGGIRTGVDAAKALALGATLVGVARPLLQAALEGEGAVDAWLEQFLNELRTVLFLTGSDDLASLRQKPRVVTGTTRAWLDQLA